MANDTNQVWGIYHDLAWSKVGSDAHIGGGSLGQWPTTDSLFFMVGWPLHQLSWCVIKFLVKSPLGILNAWPQRTLGLTDLVALVPGPREKYRNGASHSEGDPALRILGLDSMFRLTKPIYINWIYIYNYIYIYSNNLDQFSRIWRDLCVFFIHQQHHGRWSPKVASRDCWCRLAVAAFVRTSNGLWSLPWLKWFMNWSSWFLGSTFQGGPLFMHRFSFDQRDEVWEVRTMVTGHPLSGKPILWWRVTQFVNHIQIACDDGPFQGWMKGCFLVRNGNMDMIWVQIQGPENQRTWASRLIVCQYTWQGSAFFLGLSRSLVVAWKVREKCWGISSPRNGIIISRDFFCIPSIFKQ
jgi:hypothetical protein